MESLGKPSAGAQHGSVQAGRLSSNGAPRKSSLGQPARLSAVGLAPSEGTGHPQGSRLSSTGFRGIPGGGKGPTSVRSSVGRRSSSADRPKQPNQSSGTGRSLSAERGRLSTANRGPTGASKNPDYRAEKEVNMSIVYQFLQENGYDVTKKAMSGPSTQDYIGMVQFIMGFVSSGYTVGDKYAESIPAVLKGMSYPFNISKSTMMTVGSPHAWPQLLHGLKWLIQLIKDAQYCCPAPLEGAAFDTFSTACYQLFMAGGDVEPEKETFKTHQFAQLDESIAAMKLEIEAKRQRVASNLEIMSRLDDDAKRRDYLEMDCGKFEEYLKNVRDHHTSIEVKLARTNRESDIFDKKISVMNAQIHDLQQQIEAQHLSPDQVRAVREAAQGRVNEIQELEGKLREAEQKRGTTEMAISSNLTQVQSQIQRHNARCSTAGCGSLRIDLSGGSKHIEERMQRAVKDMEEEQEEKTRALAQLRRSKLALEDQLAEKEDAIRLLEGDLSQTEGDATNDLRAQKEKVENMHFLIAARQKELSNLHQKETEHRIWVNGQRTALQEKRRRVEEETKQRKKHFNRSVKKLEVYTAHCAEIQETVKTGWAELAEKWCAHLEEDMRKYGVASFEADNKENDDKENVSPPQLPTQLESSSTKPATLKRTQDGNMEGDTTH